MTKLIISANTDWYLYNFRLALIHELRDQGFEVILLSPFGDFTNLLLQAGFRCIPWQLSQHSVSPWKELRSFLDLARIYRQERPDIVHHHTIKAVLYGSWAAAWTGVKNTINSIAGRGYILAGTDPKARFLRKLISPFYRRALNFLSDAVIFENRFDRQLFIDDGIVNPQNAVLIESVGTDPQRYFFKPEPSPPHLVLMAGRMLWDKGVGTFVEAARILHASQKIRMVLVGAPDPDNPNAVDETMLQTWHREEIIEWWGWQLNMEKIYQQAHIVVLPTHYGEGVPTTLLEAASCGRAIIATDVPGCRAIVHHELNGLLIPPQDAQALSGAIAKLSQHPALRKKMGAAGREIVLAHFTHQKINRATWQVYQHLLKSKKLE